MQFVAGILLLASICINHAAAQTWTQLAPTGGPPAARYASAGVLDAATNQMIIFGGFSLSGNLNDAWALSLSGSPQWTILSPAGTLPAPRGRHRTVYDGANARMILFGGGLGSTSPCANDVWVLANANSVGGSPTWSQLSPSGAAPLPRLVHSAVYDSASNRMTIFGGNDCFSGFYNDVWVLSSANGLGGTPAGHSLRLPERLPHRAVITARSMILGSNRMIVFGVFSAGNISNQVWVLTNANGLGGTPAWVQLAPAGPAIPAKTAHAAVYDVLSNRMIVFGGQSVSADTNDVWVLSNANGMSGTPAWMQLRHRHKITLLI